MLGGGGPGDVDCGVGPGDVDDEVADRWVGGVVAQLGNRRPGWHRVLVPGGGGDGEVIGGAGVGPAAVFFALVAAFAQTGPVGPAGGSAFGPGVAVIGILDRAIAPWGGTGIVADGQHFG